MSHITRRLFQLDFLTWQLWHYHLLFTDVSFHVLMTCPSHFMMTSSSGNIFHVLGPLYAENAPLTDEFNPTKASGAELWCLLWSAPEQTVELMSYFRNAHWGHMSHNLTTIILLQHKVRANELIWIGSKDCHQNIISGMASWTWGVE